MPTSVSVSRSKYSLTLTILPWRISHISMIGRSNFVLELVFEPTTMAACR